MFTEIEEIMDGHVSFEDASKVKVKGQDTFFIHCKDRNKRFISNIYYVQDMKSNILSLGKLLECDYTVFIKKNTLFEGPR
jgi:hypothetical protein